MKAINCSQCGALITEIPERTSLVECVYCRAKVLVAEARILEISRREADEAERKRLEWKRAEELRVSEYRARLAEEARTHHRRMATQIIVLLTLLILPFILYYLFNG